MASVVLSFSGREVKTYELDKPATVVGRDPGVDIVVDNLGVSRSHCQFLKRGEVFLIQDMKSSNGTYVNGKRVTEHNLNDNDQIVVGKYTLTYKAQGKAAAKTGPAVAAGVIPDSLNTYMMDGDKIRERLEDMRREEEAKTAATARKVEEDPRSKRGGAARPPSAPAMKPAAPAVSRTDHHARIVMGGSSGAGGLSVQVLKRYLMLSLILNLVLIVVFGVFYFFHLQSLQGRGAEPGGSSPRPPAVDVE